MQKTANIVLPNSLESENESTCKRNLNQPEILRGNPGGQIPKQGSIEHFLKSEWEPFETLPKACRMIIHTAKGNSEWQKTSQAFHNRRKKAESQQVVDIYLFYSNTCFNINVVILSVNLPHHKINLLGKGIRLESK